MSDLDRLFYWRGIAGDYINYRGEHVQVPIENRLHLLSLMGVDVSSEKTIAQEAYDLDVAPWMQWLDPLSISPHDESFFLINFKPEDLNKRFSWEIRDEKGLLIEQGEFDPNELEEIGDYLFEGARYSRRRVHYAPLAPNYYQLQVSSGKKIVHTKLAVVPSSAYVYPWLDEGKRVWGTIIHLYTLRSENNWGIGDFTDLKELIDLLSQHGGGVIGLNPLHALSTNLNDSFSPYSPSDRRFINPLYIDPSVEAEFHEDLLAQSQKKERKQLRGFDNVDYVRVHALKYQVLEVMFEEFYQTQMLLSTTRGHDFRIFVEDHFESLLPFTRYEANKQDWPNKKLSNANCDVDNLILQGSVKELFEDLGCKSVLFHCYLQWIAHRQLSYCQQLAIEKGMTIGLIKDLAVGADRCGAETATNGNLFCEQASVGAPPDPMAQTGQNWGIPPMDPAALRHTGYKHYIALLRANMVDCGALRIDHAMSLMRLWWCPPNKAASHGAYVYYPFKEMLGLLCLESQLNNCLIVGEDLGVVPDEFRHEIQSAKIYSNKVFYFEKDHNGNFTHPQDFQTQALAMVNNHDVPTLMSWWNATDIELRDQLQLIEEGRTIQELLESRNSEKNNILAMLNDANLLPGKWKDKDISRQFDADLLDAILYFESQSASQVYVIQLEDLMLMNDSVNVPGTYKEYKNWQRKLVETTSNTFASDRVKSLLKKINQR